MELHPQLRQLRDFCGNIALKLPADRHFAHAPGLIDRPSFFTLGHLQRHLNNPMLMPSWFALFWQGKRVDCRPAVAHKIVQGLEVPFLNKGILEEYLSNGAALVLEGLDILEPEVNAFCGTIDALRPAVTTNSVVFFSQRGDEAYRGHFDTDDVLVIHLAGQKKWRIHERLAPRRANIGELPPEQMGKLQAEIVMNPGDALFLKAGTTHRVETTDAYSLHMSFDMCDRTLNAETALQLVAQQFDHDATRAYTPMKDVMEKLVEHARSPAFWNRLNELQAKLLQNSRTARAMLGTNRVAHLERLIVAEKEAAPPAAASVK